MAALAPPGATKVISTAAMAGDAKNKSIRKTGASGLRFMAYPFMLMAAPAGDTKCGKIDPPRRPASTDAPETIDGKPGALTAACARA
jgi:hypothetical protein